MPRGAKGKCAGNARRWGGRDLAWWNHAVIQKKLAVGRGGGIEPRSGAFGGEVSGHGPGPVSSENRRTQRASFCADSTRVTRISWQASRISSVPAGGTDQGPNNGPGLVGQPTSFLPQRSVTESMCIFRLHPNTLEGRCALVATSREVVPMNSNAFSFIFRSG
jgi:hypothetical protein